MGFLSPLLLALGLGAAVPLLIHLLRRRTGVRIEFPAVRYLARAEQEHSRRLKLRNLLLMFLRVLAVLAIALAAARPVSTALGRVVGAGHAPTAVAVVLDNSLSTSVIVNGRPVLDALKAVVRGAASRAGPADRMWLVTADGRTQGGTPGAISSAVGRVTPLAGAGNLTHAVATAASLARSSGVTDPVVAVVTDGQATAWPSVIDAGSARIVAFAPGTPAPANRAVTDAAARPTRWTPRGEIAAVVTGEASPGAPEGDSTTYRITLGPRTLARGTVALPGTSPAVPGAGAISVHAAPPERGWTVGSVELEPDELRGDDTRYFAVWIGEPPTVAVDSTAGPFLQSAVGALVASGRAAVGPPRSGARTLQITEADHLTSLPAFITPPTDPVRLGAANRALERAGVPWRFGAPVRGEATIEDLVDTPSGARSDSGATGPPITATLRYPLQPQTDAIADTLATTGSTPWAVAGPGYVIVATPIDPTMTSWPVRAGFVPWLGDILGQRLSTGTVAVGARASGIIDVAPGASMRRPVAADGLEMPDGSVQILNAPTLTVPANPGVYFLRHAGVRVGAVVVNPEPSESDLARLSPRDLAKHFHGRRVDAFSNADRWSADAFDSQAERPLTAFFIAVALVCVLAEVLLTRRGTSRATGALGSVRRAA